MKLIQVSVSVLFFFFFSSFFPVEAFMPPRCSTCSLNTCFNHLSSAGAFDPGSFLADPTHCIQACKESKQAYAVTYLSQCFCMSPAAYLTTSFVGDPPCSSPCDLPNCKDLSEKVMTVYEAAFTFKYLDVYITPSNGLGIPDDQVHILFQIFQ